MDKMNNRGKADSHSNERSYVYGSWERHSGHGHNFGDGATPYGEDYGGESDYDDFKADRRRTREPDTRRAGFRHDFSHVKEDPRKNTRFPESFEVRGIYRMKRQEDLRRFPMPGRYHYSDPWFDATAEGYDRRMRDNRGKGPKNYRRADERIMDDIHLRLTEDDAVDASDVNVEVREREVILSGTVGDRASRRRVEVIAENVSGVTHVENQIRVRG